jgi:hypothetical protein
MTGTRQADQISRPLAALKELGLTIVEAPITSIDPASRTITAGDKSWTGDALILALGAEADATAIPGLSEEPGNFYTIAGATAIWQRLPHTLSVSFAAGTGRDILERIPELAASTGSACHSGMDQVSPVLRAMKVEKRAGQGTIRFSLGRYTTQEEIDEALRLLRSRVSRMIPTAKAHTRDQS